MVTGGADSADAQKVLTSNSMAASTPNAPEVQPSRLKRLGIVSWVLNLAVLSTTDVYLRFRSVVPSAIVPSVKKVEETVAAVAAPYVAKGQDAYSSVLRFADDEVDIVLSVLEKQLAGIKSTAKAGTDSINDVAQPYLQALLTTASKITQRIHTASGLQAVQKWLQELIVNADPDQAVKVATDAWARVAAFPPVATFLRITEPLSSRGLWAFNVFHDRLVTTRIYKLAVDTTSSTLTYASTTTPYKLSAQYLYPVVQPVAEPAFDKVTKSNVVQKTMEFWKPVVI